MNGKIVLGDYAKSKGVDFRFSTPMVRLVQDESGKVTGAIAKSSDGYIKINASKGTVVCTADTRATKRCSRPCSRKP